MHGYDSNLESKKKFIKVLSEEFWPNFAQEMKRRSGNKQQSPICMVCGAY